MKPSIKKFLEFNGNDLYFTLIDKTWWIALRPICEALNVDWKNQHDRLLNDKILSQLSSEQRMVAADGKERKMTCLPEFYIYGWLFQIQSQSPELLEYKWECYRILFDHFHGAITQRGQILADRIMLQKEIAELDKELESNEKHQTWLAKRKLKKEKSNLLTYMDKDLATGQISLFKYSDNN